MSGHSLYQPITCSMIFRLRYSSLSKFGSRSWFFRVGMPRPIRRRLNHIDPGITIAFISRQTWPTTRPRRRRKYTRRIVVSNARLSWRWPGVTGYPRRRSQAVAQQVDLGGKTATGVAQRMISWLFNFRRHTFVQTRTMMVMVAIPPAARQPHGQWYRRCTTDHGRGVLDRPFDPTRPTKCGSRCHPVASV